MKRLRQPRVHHGAVPRTARHRHRRDVRDARHQRGFRRGCFEAPDAAAVLGRGEKERPRVNRCRRRHPGGDPDGPRLTQRAPLQQAPARYLHHRERALGDGEDARAPEGVQPAELPLARLGPGPGLGGSGRPGTLGHVRLERRGDRAPRFPSRPLAALQPRLRDPQSSPRPRREHPLALSRLGPGVVSRSVGSGVAGQDVETPAVRSLPGLSAHLRVDARGYG